MILFVHLATSDLMKRGLPLTDPAQPWVCGLAAALATPAGETVSYLSTLVQPDAGMQIRPEATARHGIETREAAKTGIGGILALGILCQFARKADVVVGHAIDFEKAVVESVLMRAGKDTRLWTRPGLRFIDTMAAATPFCRIEATPPREDGQFKWPSLSEACASLLGDEPAAGPVTPQAALVSVIRLFKHLSDRGAFADLEAA